IGTGSTFVDLQSTAAATSIQGGDGNDTVYFEGAGTATSIQTGANSDQIYFFNASAWNTGITIDGGSGFDTLYLYPSNATLDLRSATLTNLESINLNGSNLTALIDADALTGITNLSGNSSGNNKFVTADATLDLSGKSVSAVTIESSNVTGTTFTVSNSTSAFQVLGGSGSDTIQTSNFAFTATQRDAIFNGSSIELIHDTSGFYGDETANTITGTAAADNIQGGGGADRITGAAGLDSLSGGAGGDTFVFNFPSEGMDTISDFVPLSDSLEISAAGFGSGLVAGSSATLITASDVSLASHAGSIGYFIFVDQGTNAGTVYWDATGGSGTDAIALVKLQGVASLASSDFHLV
ncbi:hypothetical protein SAMN05216338_11038, partial [Bradyrhizobium sp. Rc2d]|uniref:hypothetical protein n=1 Tax=Bradyrhizobium sp. Rc2d TaxID=1855321 RepID=UPI000887B03B